MIAVITKQHLGYARVSVQTIRDLPAFLEAASQSPPDLFLIYLYFGDPASETVPDPATSRAAIQAKLGDATGDPPNVTGCGLEIVTCLRAEFGKPLIVLTGCADTPGRATRVEQAGASALLTLPFATADWLAAIGSCVEGPLTDPD